MKPYTIHKPHFELRDFKGTPRGSMQWRKGDYVCVNLVTGEKAMSNGPTCSDHLTNYLRGTESAGSKQALLAALHYLFGDAAPRDVIAVKINEES